jgi:Uma2 family endonuclease
VATIATPARLDWLADALVGLSPGQRVYATGVPWAVYLRLAELRDERRPGVKITFDRGRIELMSPKIQHEQPHFRLGLVVMTLAEELGVELRNAGATTLRREAGEQGLEADDSFYISHVQDVLGVRDIDLTVHPPPDLVIEIDLTSSSVGKEAIYGPMGVPELWRMDEGRVAIRHLQVDRTYLPVSRSIAFPQVTADDLTRLLAETEDEGELAFVRRCRTWAKSLTPPAPNP